MKSAVYVRKSREEETEDTLNRQLSVLTDLCKKNGWEYEVFKEVGSSQDLDRPQLQAMLEKVKLFMFDSIVVADLDRLSRNTVHFGQIKEVIISAGVSVITPNKAYDFTKQEDDLFSDLQSVLSKNEYQTIRKRLMRGTRQSAKEGNWLGKKTPLGYSYNKETKRLKPNQDASVVQRMFEEYANGLSTKDIAYKFNNEGVMTSTGMNWSSAGISRMTDNVAYIGHSLYGKTTSKNGKRSVKTSSEEQILVKDTHEPIISQELWDEVHRLKQERNSRPLSLKLGKHKFSGLIRCGLCGSIHSFQTARGKKRITSCQTREYLDDENYTVCENQGISVKEFEELFYQEFSKYVEELQEYVHLIEPQDKSNVESEIQSKQRQISRLNQDIKRIQQGYIMEIFTEDQAHKQIKGIRARISSIEQEIENLQEDDNSEFDYVKEVLERLTGFLTNKDNVAEREANSILKEVIDGIIYTKTDSKLHVEVVYK